MSVEYHDVALVGFSPSEFGTFETFFRLISSRRPRPFRATAEVAGARVVMLSTAVIEDIERTLAAMKPDQTLLTVGTRRVEGATRHLERPINLNAVLASVDAVINGPSLPTGPVASPSQPVAQSRPTAAVNVASPLPISTAAPPRPAPPPMSAVARELPQPPVAYATPSTHAPVQRELPRVPLPARPAAVADFVGSMNPPVSNAPQSLSTPASNGLQRGTQGPDRPLEATQAAALVNILVVDDSDVALKFIHARLSAFGFNVDKCSNGEEALVKVADENYQFVFLDVMMEGLDGYQTCKAIKARKYAGGKAPVVVMLTSRSGTIDKIKGTFAGCDAYLTKPLDETKMLKVLLKHDSDLGNAVSTLANPQSNFSPPPSLASNAKNPLAAAYANLSDGSR